MASAGGVFTVSTAHVNNSLTSHLREKEGTQLMLWQGATLGHLFLSGSLGTQVKSNSELPWMSKWLLQIRVREWSTITREVTWERQCSISCGFVQCWKHMWGVCEGKHSRGCVTSQGSEWGRKRSIFFFFFFYVSDLRCFTVLGFERECLLFIVCK